MQILFTLDSLDVITKFRTVAIFVVVDLYTELVGVFHIFDCNVPLVIVVEPKVSRTFLEDLLADFISGRQVSLMSRPPYKFTRSPCCYYRLY